MAFFAYRAINAAGQVVTGEMECANDADLEARLARLDLELIRAREIRPRIRIFPQGRVTRREMITLCFQMEQLAAAGVPILDGLIDLRDTLEEGPLRSLAADLAESIQGGLQLSEAVKRHPRAFTPVMASLIRAGEVSGELQRVFDRLTQALKWEDELVAQSKKLLLYPAFAGAVVLAVSLFLLLYLIPQLAGFIKGMNKEVPLPTLVMIWLSDWVRSFWQAIPPALAAVPVALAAYARSGPQARLRLDRWKLDAWLVGPILRKVALARFTGFFSMMYSAGVPVQEALQVGEKVAGNLVIENAIRQAREAILHGKSIAEGFQVTGMFPPLVLRMLRIGETTGDLDKALDNVNYFYDRDVREGIAKIQAMMEPILTIVLGIVLGAIMFAALGPIYDVISRIRI